MIDDSLEAFLTDLRFNAHLTVFRKNELEDTEKAQIVASMREYKLPSLVIKKCTLRERKTGSVIKDPLVQPEFSAEFDE